jgi:thiamine-phosphate pyrophosphorylase
LAPTDVRRVLSESMLIGLSTHNDTQVAEALMQPIDYVAIGPVFATSTKINPDPIVGVAGVRAAVAAARPRGLPVVAVGGISLDRVESVLETEAASIAVIAGLLEGEPGERAAAYVRAVGP